MVVGGMKPYKAQGTDVKVVAVAISLQAKFLIAPPLHLEYFKITKQEKNCA